MEMSSSASTINGGASFLASRYASLEIACVKLPPRGEKTGAAERLKGSVQQRSSERAAVRTPR